MQRPPHIFVIFLDFSLFDAWHEFHLVRPRAPEFGEEVVSACDEDAGGDLECRSVGESHQLVVLVVPFRPQHAHAVAHHAHVGPPVLQLLSLLLQARLHSRVAARVG